MQLVEIANIVALKSRLLTHSYDFFQKYTLQESNLHKSLYDILRFAQICHEALPANTVLCERGNRTALVVSIDLAGVEKVGQENVHNDRNLQLSV